MKVLIIVVVFAVIAIVAGGIWLTWPLDNAAHPFASFRSPGGQLEVVLLRRRALPWPSTEGFDVIAEVRNQKGTRIATETVYQVDLWSDAPAEYHEVLFKDGVILIGPDHPSESRYFRLELPQQRKGEQAHAVLLPPAVTQP